MGYNGEKNYLFFERGDGSSLTETGKGPNANNIETQWSGVGLLLIKLSYRSQVEKGSSIEVLKLKKRKVIIFLREETRWGQES